MAEELNQRGYWPGSYLMGWVAAEALIRILLKKANKTSEQMQPLAAVKTAYALGLLAHDDYSLLGRCFEARNRLAHGFRSDLVSHSDVSRLIELARRLQSEVRSPVDQDDADDGDDQASLFHQ
jgi:hypothetical protein